LGLQHLQWKKVVNAAVKFPWEGEKGNAKKNRQIFVLNWAKGKERKRDQQYSFFSLGGTLAIESRPSTKEEGAERPTNVSNQLGTKKGKKRKLGKKLGQPVLPAEPSRSSDMEK